MPQRKIEQEPDSLVVDKAKTFRATPAVTVLEQQAFDDTARLIQHRAQMLGDGGAQFALVPGMRRGQLFELGYDCRPVEQIREVAPGVGDGQHGEPG